MKFNTLSIVIPVYNEKDNLPIILDKVSKVDIPLKKEIILIDDFSTDGTRDYLKTITDPNINIFYQDKNRGKGAALQRGFKEASGDITIIQDADLEYDPRDYPKLLQPIIEGLCDVVYGSRYIGGSTTRVMFFGHAYGNRLLTFYSNFLNNIYLSDMETCYKVMKTSVIKNIKLTCNRFGIEPEMTAKISRTGATIFEMPINYYGRSYEEGKKITWKDGIAAFYYITKFGLASRLIKRKKQKSLKKAMN
jgi:glycosyltransferase involved in cell wall biosynthesis